MTTMPMAPAVVPRRVSLEAVDMMAGERGTAAGVLELAQWEEGSCGERMGSETVV